VVVTGGEPMLFAELIPLTEELRARGLHITIETAGTLDLPVSCDLMSISPKLSTSTPEGDWSERHERTRINLPALRGLTKNYNYQLKFVICDPGHDRAEIKELLAAIGNVDPGRVMVMAEGRDAVTLHARERDLVPICMEEGWRLTPRFQIDLFGDTRGT
jgi:7-carboxy-7-deazaguanine synthase